MTASDVSKCSRRAFTQSVCLGVAAGLAPTIGLSKVFEGYEPRSLTVQELDTVKALMSRLIPADSKSGGAVEACAHIYLDQAIGAHHARHLGTYRTALAQLDRLARAQHSATFAKLPLASMDAVIARMEKGELPTSVFADGGTSFFNLLRRHTLEGFLTDPMYGGNQEFIGWRAIGYNGIQLAYSPATQQLNGRDEREPRSLAAFGGSPMP